MPNPVKSEILFLCTGNSCRSQMAEGFTRALQGDRFIPYSAGVTPKGIDPRAVKAMAEVGIDISGRTSKEISAMTGRKFEYVVTVCNQARESCPVFPGMTKPVHQGFDDPPELAAGAANEEEAMRHYRRVRDEIRAFVQTMPGSLENRAADPAGSTVDAIGGFLKGLT